MSVREYRDDDTGYLDWLATHPDGYVINIHRSHSPIDARLHDASCSTLSAQIHRDVLLTDQYVKVCGQALAEVEQWAADQVGEPILPCGTCRGTRELRIEHRDVSQRGGNASTKQRGAGMCPKCSSYQLSVTGKCPSCDED